MFREAHNYFLKLNLTVLATMGILLAGCGGSPEAGTQTSEKKIVVCTTTIIEDLCQVLASDTLNIRGIMKAGEDPHIYELTPQDTILISSADLILMNGLNLEAQMGNVINKQAKGKVTKLTNDTRIITAEEEDGAPDPHCWFHPEFYKIYLEKALTALIEIDPDNSERYNNRAIAYAKELDDIYAWGKEAIAEIPQERRILVTSHDAFQYLGQAFDIKVAAVGGISTETDPTPQDRIKLETIINETGAKALFVESSVRDSLNTMIKQIAESTGAKVGGELHSDSLGPKGQGADTYLTMLKHNLSTIIGALK